MRGLLILDDHLRFQKNTDWRLILLCHRRLHNMGLFFEARKALCCKNASPMQLPVDISPIIFILPTADQHATHPLRQHRG